MAFTTGTKYLLVSPNMAWLETRSTEAEAIALAESLVDGFYSNIHIIPCTTITHVEE